MGLTTFFKTCPHAPILNIQTLLLCPDLRIVLSPLCLESKLYRLCLTEENFNCDISVDFNLQ